MRQRIAARQCAALVLATWLAWPAADATAQAAGAVSPSVLRDLTSVAELQSSFDADRDKIRIVLLLSPT